jgi:hypothetical protein
MRFADLVRHRKPNRRSKSTRRMLVLSLKLVLTASSTAVAGPLFAPPQPPPALAVASLGDGPAGQQPPPVRHTSLPPSSSEPYPASSPSSGS